jgi:hypothetical protein
MAGFGREGDKKKRCLFSLSAGKPGIHFRYSFPIKENENVENSE